jgi:hypothetical protein
MVIASPLFFSYSRDKESLFTHIASSPSYPLGPENNNRNTTSISLFNAASIVAFAVLHPFSHSQLLIDEMRKVVPL